MRTYLSIEMSAAMLKLLNEIEAIDDNEDEDVGRVEPLPKRRKCLPRIRWEMDRLVSLALRENSFTNEFRVSKMVFDLLVARLRVALQTDTVMAGKAMSKSGNGPITVEARVACGLRMLGGARVMEPMRVQGLAKSTVYKIFRQFVRAVNQCPNFSVVFDTDVFTLKHKAAEFKKAGTHGLFDYCCGAIDGIFIRLECPSVMNALHYFSGSKMGYGINLQVNKSW
jgi:hypothetical protein